MENLNLAFVLTGVLGTAVAIVLVLLDITATKRKERRGHRLHKKLNPV